MEERNIDNELFNPEEMKLPFDDIKEHNSKSIKQIIATLTCIIRHLLILFIPYDKSVR